MVRLAHPVKKFYGSLMSLNLSVFLCALCGKKKLGHNLPEDITCSEIAYITI
jgi:hypothetical protein